MANSLPQQIHNHLNCPPSRVKEILEDLASIKAKNDPDKPPILLLGTREGLLQEIWLLCITNANQ